MVIFEHFSKSNKNRQRLSLSLSLSLARSLSLSLALSLSLSLSHQDIGIKGSVANVRHSLDVCRQLFKERKGQIIYKGKYFVFDICLISKVV